MEKFVQNNTFNSTASQDGFFVNAYPANISMTSTTPNGRCSNGHTWTWAGNIGMNLEGIACDCGELIFHTEPCECCGQSVNKHKPKNGK